MNAPQARHGANAQAVVSELTPEPFPGAEYDYQAEFSKQPTPAPALRAVSQTRNTAETHALIVRAQNGDEHAKETLVHDNLALVKSVVRKFIGRGVEWDDLYQLGSMGLLKAIMAFDVSFNVRFSTYAVPVIMGEVRRFLRDDGQVKVSRTLKENAVRIRQAAEALRGEDGREPALSQIALRVGLPVEEVALSLESGRATVSLDQPLQDGELRLMDVVPDDTQQFLEQKVMLKMLLQTLPVKERQLIFMRYFQDKTQSEIAEQLSMTQVQVSRLERRILDKMKAGAADDPSPCEG